MVLVLAFITTIILLLTSAFLVHKYVSRNYNYWKKRKVTFPRPQPFFGNFFDVAAMKFSIGDFLGTLYKSTTEPVLGFFVFGTPQILIRKPEIIKDIIIKDFDRFSDRCMLSSKHDPTTSHLLFFVNNPDWKILRSKISPCFSTKKLKFMFDLIKPIANEMKIFIKQNLNITLDAQHLCSLYLTDVVTMCTFSFRINSFKNPNNEIKKISHRMVGFQWSRLFQQTSYIFFPSFAKSLKFPFYDPKITDFFQKLYRDSMTEREKINFTNDDFLGTLKELEHDEQFCKQLDYRPEKIVGQAIQFYTAGLDTTGGTLAFALFELCLNLKIQIKLQDEITKTKQKYGYEIDYETIKEMNYLNMVVLECLRKYPSVPYLDRVSNNDYHVFGSDLVIEKGTFVFISILGLHYDPEYFPEPNKFIPERFETNSKPSFVYMPFGDGPRNCIGQRLALFVIKMGLISILSDFNIKAGPETPSSIVIDPKNVFLSSKNKLNMIFEKRTV